jgi:hypothetical protein
MKKIVLILLFFAFWPCCGWPQATSVTSTPSAKPYKTLKWETYTNSKYGFSIQYPLVDIPEPRPVDRQNIWDENEIDVPTPYGDDGFIIRNLTDASVKKWNNQPVQGEDAEGFPYAMTDLYATIKLPVGSKCPAFKYGKVVNLNGVKALRLVLTATLVPRIEYFIYRGGTSWLEIDEFLNASSEQMTGEMELTAEAKKQKVAHDVVLKTLKLFDSK